MPSTRDQSRSDAVTRLQIELVLALLFDHAQIRSYGLSAPATALLEAIADFEIASLLDRGMRLRTRCDLVVRDITKGERPDAADAVSRIGKFAADARDELGPVTDVTWSDSVRSAKASKG